MLFISPHLDDAVLSCGALIETAARHCPVVVATVFTTAEPPPHTFAGRSFLAGCGGGSAGALFAARRGEDAEVLARLGLEPVHLGFPDALFRRRRTPGGARKRLGDLVPELAHRYPTYRYDIARGRISRGDRPMIATIVAAVAATVASTGARLVFCPLGVGRHVDHLIARTVGTQFPDRVIYYSDFPYDRSAPADSRFVAEHRLTPRPWDQGIAGKAQLIRGYRSQVGGLFPGGDISVAPEVYYGAER